MIRLPDMLMCRCLLERDALMLYTSATTLEAKPSVTARSVPEKMAAAPSTSLTAQKVKHSRPDTSYVSYHLHYQAFNGGTHCSLKKRQLILPLPYANNTTRSTRHRIDQSHLVQIRQSKRIKKRSVTIFEAHRTCNQKILLVTCRKAP